jgi:hypothetical protein
MVVVIVVFYTKFIHFVQCVDLCTVFRLIVVLRETHLQLK